MLLFKVEFEDSALGCGPLSGISSVFQTGSTQITVPFRFVATSNKEGTD